MECDLESHAILWRMISRKLNIGKKITGLQLKDIESPKNLACFEIYRTDV